MPNSWQCICFKELKTVKDLTPKDLVQFFGWFLRTIDIPFQLPCGKNILPKIHFYNNKRLVLLQKRSWVLIRIIINLGWVTESCHHGNSLKICHRVQHCTNSQWWPIFIEGWLVFISGWPVWEKKLIFSSSKRIK